MNNKELFYFLGQCLMLDEQPKKREEVIEKINTGNIDWQNFVTLGSNHLVLPAIFLKFEKHNLSNYLPVDLPPFLKEIYDLNNLRNEQILFQIKEVTALLNKNNIYPLFLKGAAHLLVGLYTGIGERILGDIDFLVPEKDYLPTAILLEAEGYSTIEGSPAYFEPETLKHYPRLMKPGSPADLEIHRLLTNDSLSWFNTAIMEREKKPVIAISGCFVPSDKQMIIHNFVHSQLSHDGHINGLLSFRDLYDLYLLSKRTPLAQVIPDIKSKRKALDYFAFADNAFGLDKTLCSERGSSARLFTRKHDLNYSSPLFFNIHRTILFISRKVFAGYIGQTLQSIYSKKMRRSVIGRLTSRQWYRAHFQTYLDFFNLR
jgi:hypothetical protein